MADETDVIVVDESATEGTSVVVSTSVTIDVKAIGDLYESLMAKAQNTVNNYVSKNSLTNMQAVQIMSNVIGNVLSVSAKIVQDAPIQAAQYALISKQVQTEEEKAALTVRQREAYDDNLRIKEGELLSNVMGMFGAGGTTLPSGLSTAALNAIARITSGGATTVLNDTNTPAT